MKKALISRIVLIVGSVAMVSCGSYNNSNGQQSSSQLKFRAFVSNPLFPSGSGNVAVINIVDAVQDALTRFTITLQSRSTQAGLMAVAPDLKRTIVFSSQGNTITTVDNTTQTLATATNGTASVPTITLPGSTESIFIAKDNLTGYAAVPSASITGQPLGAVVAMDLGTGTVRATIPVAGAHFIVPSPDGNRILVFSDNSNAITIINTILIGTSQDPRTTVNGFDRPVWAIFTDDTSAFVFNCGAECPGGTAAGIATFDVGNPGPTTVLPLSGATYGLLSGTTLYVAGTPPNTACGSGTSATSCGTLNVVDTNSMTLSSSSPIIIPDGYHDRMQLGSNGKLFVGAHGCTNVNGVGGEVRGCLSIFNTGTSKVIVPPQIGDATGIAAVAGRNVVYVCQGGVFQIYDTTTDQLLVQIRTIDIVGQSTDVKVVDPPPS